MTQPRHDHLTAGLVPAVLEAGESIMGHRSRGVAVEMKADESPVTAADREAEQILTDALGRIAPGIPVIAEEAMAAGHEAKAGDIFFLVDALDGTREFVAGSTDFTVNIGLVVDGRPVWGIVYGPALGRLFVTTASDRAAEAVVGYGAAPRGLDDLVFAPIHTAKPSSAGLRATVSGSHKGGEIDAVRKAGLGVAGIERRGSSLKFGLVAAGEADLYPRFGETSAWDTAAGHALVLAAGGTVTTLDGSDLTYPHTAGSWRNPGFVVWGDPKLVVPVRK